MNDLNELFNGISFNEYARETENNLPVGLKILETQAESLSRDEERIRTWINCYGLKMDNFPTIDETNTLVKSEKNEEGSLISYRLPFNGEPKLLFIRPTGVSHKLQCTIDGLGKTLLKNYPVRDNFSEEEQREEIGNKFKLFVSNLKESLDSLRADMDLFNEKVATAVLSVIEETTKKSGNNELLVSDLQNEVGRL